MSRTTSPSSGPDAAMRARSIEALRLAEAETGDCPSFRRYDAAVWIVDRSGVGSWSAMLDALGVEPTVRPATIARRSLGELIAGRARRQIPACQLPQRSPQHAECDRTDD